MSRLPHRPGHVVVHGHDEGEACSADCRYRPTLLGSARLALALLRSQPRPPVTCSHGRDLARACPDCRSHYPTAVDDLYPTTSRALHRLPAPRDGRG